MFKKVQIKQIESENVKKNLNNRASVILRVYVIFLSLFTCLQFKVSSQLESSYRKKQTTYFYAND